MICFTRFSLALLLALCFYSKFAVGRTGPRDSVGTAKNFMGSFPGAVSRNDAEQIYDERSLGGVIGTSMPSSTTTMMQGPSETSYRASQSNIPGQPVSQASYGNSETITTYSSDRSGGYGGQESGIGALSAPQFSTSGTGGYSSGGYGIGGGGSGNAAGSGGYTEIISFGGNGSGGASSASGGSGGARGYDPRSGGYGPRRVGSMGASGSGGPVNAADLSNPFEGFSRQARRDPRPDFNVALEALIEVVTALVRDGEEEAARAAAAVGDLVGGQA